MSLFNWKKKNENKVNELTISNEVQMLFARLLFYKEPILDDKAIHDNLLLHFKDFGVSNNSEQNSRHYFVNDYKVEYQEGKMSAQFTLFKPTTNEYIEKCLELAYRQLWHWSEAQQKTNNCKYEIVLTDLMTRPLDYKVRVDIFQKYVCSIALALKPTAIYFPTSEKIVEPTEYIENVLNQEKDFLYGLLNIRLFNIEDNGLLMDSLGLSAMGLPDFQYRFYNHEPGQIAGLLNSYSHYIYEHGSVIKNGNTLDGLQDGILKCTYNSALIEPIRNVLDIQE